MFKLSPIVQSIILKFDTGDYESDINASCYDHFSYRFMTGIGGWSGFNIHGKRDENFVREWYLYGSDGHLFVPYVSLNVLGQDIPLTIREKFALYRVWSSAKDDFNWQIKNKIRKLKDTTL